MVELKAIIITHLEDVHPAQAVNYLEGQQSLQVKRVTKKAVR